MSDRSKKLAESVMARLRARLAEEVEELDELSKGTLARYAIRAKNQLARSEFGAGREVGMRNMDGKGQGEMEKAYNRRADKRHQGLDMAIDKLAKEEVEELDELSKSTLGSYVKKATNQVFSKGVAGGMGLASSNKEDEASGHRQVNKAAKRMLGVNTAASKLSGHGYTKVPAKEEVEDFDDLSEERKRTSSYHFTHTPGDAESEKKLADLKNKVRGTGKRVVLQGRLGKDNPNAKKYQLASRKAGTYPTGGHAYQRIAKADAKHFDVYTYHKEEVEDLDEISQMMARAARDKAGEEIAGHRKAIEKEWNKNKPNYGKISDIQQQWERRKRLSDKVTRKLAKEEADMLDTALSDVKQSSRGEVYSKSTEKCSAPTKPTGTKTGVTAGKTGEAYNTTAATKRIAAVESTVADIMAKSMERRRIYNESANIAIISPEQRSDWMNVERGMMNVVDYFNKYRAGEE